MRACLLLLTLAGVTAGCAPTYHVPPDIRYDRPRAAALETHAVEECTAWVGADKVPKRTFVTDGCTLWPDGWWTGLSWEECCVEHDIAYWCGGPEHLRTEADAKLEQCVTDDYAHWMGALMHFGTWLGGGRYVPVHWRWGYGHNYPDPS